ncbi:glutaredoxin family protein [Pseudomonas sp. KU43P]|nr:glutaredoxin family protein [Pseudomonas sp. KU43P]
MRRGREGPRIGFSSLQTEFCSMLPECQLFGTVGCHLCEVAEALLMPFVDHGLLVELVDIADSEALFERYGLIIPVLRRSDTSAELHWPFDAEQVVAFLAQ